jgi:hypothetical protein
LQGRTGLGWALASTLAVAVVAGASKVVENVLSAELGWDDVVHHLARSSAAVEQQGAVGVSGQDLLAYALSLGAGARPRPRGGRPALVAPWFVERAVPVAWVPWLEGATALGTGAEDLAHASRREDGGATRARPVRLRPARRSLLRNVPHGRAGHTRCWFMLGVCDGCASGRLGTTSGSTWRSSAGSSCWVAPSSRWSVGGGREG